MIYYAIRPAFSPVTRYVKSGNYRSVYDKILFITDNHDLAADAEGWCELATVGEIYDHELFTIWIIEEDD